MWKTGPTVRLVLSKSPSARRVSAQTGQGVARRGVFFTKARYSILYGRDVLGFDFLKKKAGFFNSSGYGLFSIRERLHYLGGSFDIESKLGHGTRVALTAPLKCDS